MLQLLPRSIQPPEIVIKKGSLVRLRYLQGKKAVVICGKKSLRESGKLQEIITHLSSAMMDVVVIENINKEPDESTVQDCLDRLKSISPDWVIGCGGGSVIDCAKIAYVLYAHPHINLKELYKPHNIPEKDVHPKFAAIPTTAGSGSEASSIAVITTKDEAGNVKKQPILSHALMPSLAILDATLTATLSPQETTATGLDALTHAFEAYCSTASHVWSDAHALVAGQWIRDSLPRVVEDPHDMERREKMLYASFHAAQAQNMAFVGATHAFAHVAGVQYGISHGLACGLFLPHVILLNEKHTSKARRFARSIGFDSAEALAKWVQAQLVNVELPANWKKTVSENASFDIEDFISRAMQDPCMRTAPKRLKEEEWIQVLEHPPVCISNHC